jgi:4-amino-4-deoxy-L-arabinose transferase-like glycosyltransferase
MPRQTRPIATFGLHYPRGMTGRGRAIARGGDVRTRVSTTFPPPLAVGSAWRRFRRLAVAAPAFAATAYFVAISTVNLRLPGLYYDELIQIVPSAAFVEGGFSSAVDGHDWINIHGHAVPLMTMDYIGAVKTIAFAPIVAVFGMSITSIRVFQIAVAAVALLLTYLFAKRLFRSRIAGAFAAVLLAADPSYVFFTRTDLGPVDFMFLAKALSLVLLLDWWRTGRLRSLVAGALTLGIGTYDKADFIWIDAAIVVAALAVNSRGLMRRLDVRTAASAISAFLLGAAPLIQYNLRWPMPTFSAAGGYAGAGEPPGHLGARVSERTQMLANLLDGRVVGGWLGGGISPPRVMSVLTCVALGVLVVLVARRDTRPSVRPLAFVALAGVLVLAAAVVTRGGFAAHHVILVYPFPHLLVAGAAVRVAALIARRSLAIPAATALMVAPISLGILTTERTYAALERTGGPPNWSSAIYSLERELSHKPTNDVVVLDWGIYTNLLALSNGRLHANDLAFGVNASPALAESLLIPVLHEPGARFVLHTLATTNFLPARANFFSAVKGARIRLRLERMIRMREGQPLFEIYVVPRVRSTAVMARRVR